MVQRYWPLGKGRIVTSPFGPRDGGFHYGVDFGRDGGSANMPVYAIADGVVQYAGAADGYGGPDPAGWLVIPGDGETWEYGHIRRLPNIRVGTKVKAGQQIAVINPDGATNGGVSPHLHVSMMPGTYDPSNKKNPLPRLRNAVEPGEVKESALPSPGVTPPPYNEYPLWSPNCEPRNGTRVDMILLHTEEGGPTKDGADRLARWLGDPARQVSYHYSVSEDPVDHGVTVVDVVDTDWAAWSALSANKRSISIVFAGSKASWTREEWLRWASRAIDVVAYLCSLDVEKYNIPKKVIKPPYGMAGGVSDHRWVTTFMRDGTHTDVGGPMRPPWTGFPWDVFEERFNYYCGISTPKPVEAKPADQKPTDLKPAKQLPQPAPVGPADDQLTLRWNCLGGQTLVEALAEVRDKVLGTNDRGKTGVK